MQQSVILILVLVLSAISFRMGYRRSLAVAGPKGARGLHSLPSHYGAYTAVWCAIPALLVFVAWSVFDNVLVTQLVVSDLPEEMRELPPDRLGLVVNDIRNVASGHVPLSGVDPAIQSAADHYLRLQRISTYALGVAVLALAGLSASWAWRRISPRLRARNRVDTVVRAALMLSSSIAILTTLGIVLSVLFEALIFFRAVSVTDFLFGLHWSPQMAIREDQVGSTGAFGGRAAVRRHHDDLRDRDAGRRAHRPALGHLPVRVCRQAVSLHRQAISGDPGGRADGGLRLLRRVDRGAVRPRLGRVLRPHCVVGKRTGCGSRDGCP